MRIVLPLLYLGPAIAQGIVYAGCEACNLIARCHTDSAVMRDCAACDVEERCDVVLEGLDEECGTCGTRCAEEDLTESLELECDIYCEHREDPICVFNDRDINCDNCILEIGLDCEFECTDKGCYYTEEDCSCHCQCQENQGDCGYGCQPGVCRRVGTSECECQECADAFDGDCLGSCTDYEVCESIDGQVCICVLCECACNFGEVCRNIGGLCQCGPDCEGHPDCDGCSSCNLVYPDDPEPPRCQCTACACDDVCDGDEVCQRVGDLCECAPCECSCNYLERCGEVEPGVCGCILECSNRNPVCDNCDGDCVPVEPRGDSAEAICVCVPTTTGGPYTTTATEGPYTTTATEGPYTTTATEGPYTTTATEGPSTMTEEETTTDGFSCDVNSCDPPCEGDMCQFIDGDCKCSSCTCHCSQLERCREILPDVCVCVLECGAGHPVCDECDSKTSKCEPTEPRGDRDFRPVDIDDRNEAGCVCVPLPSCDAGSCKEGCQDWEMCQPDHNGTCECMVTCACVGAKDCNCSMPTDELAGGPDEEESGSARVVVSVLSVAAFLYVASV